MLLLNNMLIRQRNRHISNILRVNSELLRLIRVNIVLLRRHIHLVSNKLRHNPNQIIRRGTLTIIMGLLHTNSNHLRFVLSGLSLLHLSIIRDLNNLNSIHLHLNTNTHSLLILTNVNIRHLNTRHRITQSQLTNQKHLYSHTIRHLRSNQVKRVTLQGLLHELNFTRHKLRFKGHLINLNLQNLTRTDHLVRLILILRITPPRRSTHDNRHRSSSHSSNSSSDTTITVLLSEATIHLTTQLSTPVEERHHTHLEQR